MADDKSLFNIAFPTLIKEFQGKSEDATAVQTHGPWSLDSRQDGDESSDSVDDQFDLPEVPVPGATPAPPDPIGHTTPSLAKPIPSWPAKTPQSSPAIAIKPRLRPEADETGVIGGRYQIEARIGEGGMGRVYRVKHLELGKTFALKIIRSLHVDDESVRRAFFREARLASGLSHPGVVSIVDFGEDPAFGVYMVMELLEGEPLKKVLAEKGQFSVRQACEIMLQLSDAIRYVHEKGVVHCNLKSENVLLTTERTETGRRLSKVKLLDFGLARPHTDEQQSQSIQGTPAYIAPERIKGASPAPSMDIYALGILFYELLTGSPPWTGSLHMVLACHVNEAPKPPSVVLGQPINPSLENLLLKALEKNPDDRQKSVTALMYELRTTMEMLGFTTRRRSRSKPAVPRGGSVVESVFSECPLPLACFDADGTILVGNKAFSVFVYREAVDLRGVPIRETPMARACPTINHDIRTVLAEGRALQIGITTAGSDGVPTQLIMWLTPGPEDTGHVYCAIHLVGKL